jgi:hypothetical protein
MTITNPAQTEGNQNMTETTHDTTAPVRELVALRDLIVDIAAASGLAGAAIVAEDFLITLQAGPGPAAADWKKIATEAVGHLMRVLGALGDDLAVPANPIELDSVDGEIFGAMVADATAWRERARPCIACATDQAGDLCPACATDVDRADDYRRLAVRRFGMEVD